MLTFRLTELLDVGVYWCVSVSVSVAMLIGLKIPTILSMFDPVGFLPGLACRLYLDCLLHCLPELAPSDTLFSVNNSIQFNFIYIAP